MNHRKHARPITRQSKIYGVGEAPNQCSTSIAKYDRKSARARSDTFQSPLDFIEKLCAESGTLRLIPGVRFGNVGCCTAANDDPNSHAQGSIMIQIQSVDGLKPMSLRGSCRQHPRPVVARECRDANRGPARCQGRRPASPKEPRRVPVVHPAAVPEAVRWSMRRSCSEYSSPMFRRKPPPHHQLCTSDSSHWRNGAFRAARGCANGQPRTATGRRPAPCPTLRTRSAAP